MKIKSGLRRAFCTQQGEMRIGWKMLLGVAAYAAAFYGVLSALGAAFGALFDAWGLTTENLLRAPRWAQIVVAWHTDAAYGLAYGIGGAIALALARRLYKDANFPRSSPKALWIGIAIGVGAAAASTALTLALDSMRMERPLCEPVLSMGQIVALAALALGKWSGEVLTKRLLFDPVRARWNRLAAYAVTAVATVLLTSKWSLPGVVNGVLLGIVTCALYERGGLAMTFGLRMAFSAWCTLIFGWPPATAAQPIWNLYHVSDEWLTGGSLGILHGWLCAIELLAIACWLLRNRWKSILHIHNR